MKQFSAKDIQIFVATRNRPELLKETLNSILAQREQGFELTVLDNSTNSDTVQMLKRQLNSTVNYIKTDPDLNLANFKKAKELANSAYTILFHDDDLMHPDYITMVLKCLNQIDNIDIITGGCINFTTESPRSFTQTLNGQAWVFDSKADFAGYLFSRQTANYPSNVYNTKYFKTADTLISQFEKNHDVPFTIEAISSGKAVVLHDKYCVLTRQHPKQDSKDNKSAIQLSSVFNRGDYFAKLFGAGNKNSPYYKLYCTYAYTTLKDSYSFLSNDYKQSNSWDGFVCILKERGLLSKDSLYYGNYRNNLARRLLTTNYRAKAKRAIRYDIVSLK